MNWHQFAKELDKIYTSLKLSWATAAKASGIQICIMSAILEGRKTMTFYILKKVLWHLNKISSATATYAIEKLIKCGCNPMTARTFCRKLKCDKPSGLDELLTNKNKKNKILAKPKVIIIDYKCKERRLEYKRFLACYFVEGTE